MLSQKSGTTYLLSCHPRFARTNVPVTMHITVKDNHLINGDGLPIIHRQGFRMVTLVASLWTVYEILIFYFITFYLLLRAHTKLGLSHRVRCAATQCFFFICKRCIYSENSHKAIMNSKATLMEKTPFPCLNKHEILIQLFYTLCINLKTYTFH